MQGPAQEERGEKGPAKTDAAPGFSPDAQILARLASDFFTALPGVVSVKDASGSPPSPQTDSGSTLGLDSMLKALGSALPEDLLRALRAPGPATGSVPATPAQLPPFYFLELAQSSPTQSGIRPPHGPTAEAPLDSSSVSELVSPISAAGLAGSAPDTMFGSGNAATSDSPFYFLPGKQEFAPAHIPSRLPVTPEFSVPEVPASKNASEMPVRDPWGLNPGTSAMPIDTTGAKAAVPSTSVPGTDPSALESSRLPSIPGVASSGDSLRSNSKSERTPEKSAMSPSSDNPLPTPEHFMFPGIPGIQSLPGNAGVRSLPSPRARISKPSRHRCREARRLVPWSPRGCRPFLSRTSRCRMKKIPRPRRRAWGATRFNTRPA